MNTHLAAEKAARKILDSLAMASIEGGWSLGKVIKPILAAIDEALAEQQAKGDVLVEALRGILAKDIYRGISSGLLHCDICAAKTEHPIANAASINHQEECPAGIAQAALKQVEEPKGGNANAKG